jgi:SAM-dependent methyltransferase
MVRRAPALPAAERARLARRQVWRDGEPEAEPASELARYIDHSAGRLAVTLTAAEHLLDAHPEIPMLELGSEPWLFTQLLLERGNAVTAAGFRPGEHAERAEVTIRWDGRSATVEQHLFDVERERWPFADASFELVLCMEVIEHLTFSPAHMLYEANRVLSSGGHLLLGTPNALAARRVAAMLRGRNVHHPYSGYGPHGRHNREFTAEELRLVLEQANFSVDLRTHNLPGYGGTEPFGRILHRLAALPGRRAAGRRDYLLAIARKSGPPRLAYPPELYMSIDRDRMRRQGFSFADELTLTG